MFKKNIINQIENGIEMRMSFNYLYSAIQNKNHLELFEKIMKDIISRKPIKRALEIGTHEGITTTFLTQFVDRIDTVDLRDYFMKYKLWFLYEVKDKIYPHVCPSDQSKKDLIKVLDFDFAFVDGDHQEGVLLDWELTKKCGRVLFHDYKVGEEFPDKFLKTYKHIIGLVDSLPKDEVTIDAPFAYWEAK